MACDVDLTGQDLGGLTLTPAVYCFSSSAQLTGNLQLDALGNSQAVFVFQIGSTLTTATNASVAVINGGQDCNVSWQIGSSATLGTATAFVGNILALTSVTLNTTAGVSGRALARNGAVTLDDNAITVPPCALQATATRTATAGPSPTASATATATRTATAGPSPTATPGLRPSPGPVGGFGAGGVSAVRDPDRVSARIGAVRFLAVIVFGLLAILVGVGVWRRASEPRSS